MRKEPKFLLEYNLQWFAKDGEGGEKTEPATAKKLRDARNEGQVSKSQELNHAFGLVALFVIMKVSISFIGERLMGSFALIYNKIPELIDESAGGMSVFVASTLIRNVLVTILISMAPFLAAGFVIAVLSNILQIKWKVTTKPMKPKFSKINPLSGFKRIFSKDSLFELLKSIVKIVVIIYVAYTSI